MSNPAAERIAILDWRTLIEARPETAQATVDALDKYFACFVQVPFKADGKTLDTQNCIKCDEPLTGFMGLIGRGGFQWGLAHGEGRCAGCGWPARGHHFIKDEAGEHLLTLRGLVLQYHPDFVETRNNSEVA